MTWVTWRLVGRNNRELGRSAIRHRSVEDCLEAIRQLRRDVDSTARLLLIEPVQGRWFWRLELRGESLAVAARTYQRQRESLYSLRQFLSALPDAQLPMAVIDRQAPVAEGLVVERERQLPAADEVDLRPSLSHRWLRGVR